MSDIFVRFVQNLEFFDRIS